MRLYKQVTVLLLIFATISTQAQTYNYKNFRFPDVQIKALDLNVDLSGNTSGLGNDGITGNARIFYRVFKNSVNKQKLISFTSLNNFTNDEALRFLPNPTFLRINSFRTNLNFNNIERTYASAQAYRKQFFGFGYNANANYSRDNFTSIGSGINSQLDLTFNVELQLGTGRIEPMNDVFLAQFLMNDLLQEGQITEKFSETQLFELAQLMSLVRRQRVFDFRRANIYQLTTIAEWLEKNNIPQNIKTFTILNDNWQNAFLNTRNDGSRFSIGILPWINHYNVEPERINNLDNTIYGASLRLEYTYAKAVSQHIQSDFEIYLTQDYRDFIESNIVSDAQNLTNLKTSYRLAYNPTSRTTYAIEATNDISLLQFEDFATSLQINLIANYFINNRCRIRGFIGTNGYYRSSNIGFVPNIQNSLINAGRDLPGNLFFTNNGTSYLGQKDSNISLFGNIEFNYSFF